MLEGYIKNLASFIFYPDQGKQIVRILNYECFVTAVIIKGDFASEPSYQVSFLSIT